MKAHIRNIAGHLLWTRTGVVWALWQMQPTPYGYRADKDKHEARAKHQAMLRGLHGENLFLGVCATLNPEAVVGRMIEGVTLEEHLDWAAECEATLDTLEGLGVGSRTYWLAKPLNATSGLKMAANASSAAWANFKSSYGIGPAGISDAEIGQRLHQAEQVEKKLAFFRPQRASAAQLVWLLCHAQQRGLFTDGTPPAEGSVGEELLTPSTGAALPDAVLDEGGQSDVDLSGGFGSRMLNRARMLNPLERRFVKVIPSASAETAASYQSLLVLGDLPAGGMQFPGSEFLGRIDESGQCVDWAQRVTVRAGDEVRKKNSRALTALSEQFRQRDGELSLTGMSALERSADELAEYARILEEDKNEVETVSTTIFAVAGSTAEEARDQAAELSRWFAAQDYRLDNPVGEQTDLWLSMLPGVAESPTARRYAQIAPSRSLAAAVPFASTELGDTKGPLFALNTSSGLGNPGVVHLDFLDLPKRNRSASIAFCGEKGAGKSVAMKTLAGHVLDLGGRIIAVDRTPMGEWAVWAQAVTSVVSVDVAAPEYSLDPLRLFGDVDDPDQIAAAARAAMRFQTMLLGCNPKSPEGIRLRKVFAPSYLTRHRLRSTGDVLAHLLSGKCEIEGARELGEQMALYAETDLGRAVFANDLPPLDRFAPGVVIRTHKLEAPTERELSKEFLFNEMGLEKIMGRAYQALIAALARQICFEDLNVLAVYFNDEGHYQTRSPEGLEELTLFARDDRKHNAAMAIAVHDAANDLGDETFRGLIPTRVQFRHSDKTLARHGLEFVNMDPQEMLDTLTKQLTPGEGFMLDVAGNVGRIWVLPPSRPDRNTATRTTPGETYEAYQPDLDRIGVEEST